ncbi:receptor-like protein 6 [Pistacia vera]|uniref:receptor-like protein 6 n=1 Tax=Pistacia vera TaxID=55513 RepID=UPI0012638734|nr:receptor-like protein 6 [Pistacia vera]
MWRLSWHYLLPCLFLLDLSFQAISSSPYNSSSRSIKLCSPEQSSSLLHFKSKSTLKIDSSSYYPCKEYHYPKADSWKEGRDCCSWDGVTCDSYTGHVIGLDLSYSWIHGIVNDNSSLFLLHNLQKLKLACNDFSESTISSKFGQFMKLTHLNLSFSSFYGVIPIEIFHLSKLVSLDLSGVTDSLRLPELSQHVFNKHLQNLTKLRYLHLDAVDLSLVAPGSLLNLSSTLISLIVGDTSLQDSSLRFLDLSVTNFSGQLPDTIGDLIYLNVLDLSVTNFSGQLPDTISDLIYLNVLDLTATGFSGKLPDKIGNLRYLNELHLGSNNFTGSIPTSLWNCTNITTLDLAYNKFTGKVAMSLSKLSQLRSLYLSFNSFLGQIPDVFGNLSKLTNLGLSDNNFRDGRVPSWLFTLPSLETLFLSYNKLTGPIEEFHQPGFVNVVYLMNKQIQGSIPNSMFEILNLTQLDLSFNNLSGIVKPEMLSKLKNIVMIDLSHNTLLSLVTPIKANITLPNLREFRFSSCNITEFPFFLRNSENLTNLDLSNNGILGQISQQQLESFHNLYFLNLSHNFLTSFVPFGKASMMNLAVLDLQSNLLQGPLVMLDAPNMETLLVSDNMLIGKISPFICNLSYIIRLDLSYNGLNGTIPHCLEINSPIFQSCIYK